MPDHAALAVACGVVRVDRLDNFLNSEKLLITADFFDVIAFGKTAQFITDYFHKGSKILLRGRLSTSKWVDSHIQQRTDVKISVENAYFMESKRNANNMQKNENANFAYPNNPDFTDVTSDDEEVPFK